MKKEVEKSRKKGNRPKRNRKWPTLTLKEIAEVNRRDEERKKELERHREWQIQTFGYYDPGAADY